MKKNPKGDTTQARRQKTRRAGLAQAAKRDGFPTSTKALTAWKNGTHRLIDLEVLKRLGWKE